MSAIVKFPAELTRWIEHNLERGCTPQAVLDGMLAQNFDPDVAQAILSSVIAARQQGLPLPLEVALPGMNPATQEQAYVYEAPRLPNGALIRTHDKDVPVLMRLQQPVVAVLGEVLSAQECDQLIELSRDRLRPSTVVDPETGRDKIAEHRDSDGMFFALQESPFIARLDLRISQIMNLPVEHGEGLQILRYGPLARNTPHFDFLVPSNEANRASLRRSGQRISTLVIYLNDVEAGGETTFPELGLSVLPKKGHAVYFEYGNSLGQVDHKSVHAGAPVQAGEKWAVTKWMRERRFTSA